MRAAVYYNNSDVRIEEMPVPEIGPGETLVHIRASGICGSDVLEWYRVPKAPIVLGHEVAGDVVAVGEGVTNVAVGDRVVVSHHVPCNTCRLLPARQPHGLPHASHHQLRSRRVRRVRARARAADRPRHPGDARLDDLRAGQLRRAARVRGARAGACRRASGLDGARGGQRHLRAAPHPARAGAGCGPRVRDRRERVPPRLGAQERRDAGLRRASPPATRLPDLLREANDGNLADLVILGTGAPSAIDQGLACLENGATFVVFAVPAPGVDHPMPLNELWRREVIVRTAYGAAPADLAMAMDLIATGRVHVDDLITHRLPLERAAEGFALVADAGESVKVVVEG